MIKPVVQPGETQTEFFVRAVPLAYASEKNIFKIIAVFNAAWKNREQ